MWFPCQQAAPVVLQAVKLFAEQDAPFYRSGGDKGNVSLGRDLGHGQATEELKADEARVKQQLDALQQQFDALQQKLTQIDAEIGQNTVRWIASPPRAFLWIATATRFSCRYPLIFRLKRYNDSLTAQKQPLLQQQNDLRKKAKDVQAQIPVPKFTGVQQIIGVEGTPMRDTADAMQPRPRVPAPISSAANAIRSVSISTASRMQEASSDTRASSRCVSTMSNRDLRSFCRHSSSDRPSVMVPGISSTHPT